MTMVTVMAESEWVLLAYRLPRDPSGPRVTVWRKLRRLGAVQLVDGLVALPADAATVEAFDWLADEVVRRAARPGHGRPGPVPSSNTTLSGNGCRMRSSRSTDR